MTSNIPFPRVRRFARPQWMALPARARGSGHNTLAHRVLEKAGYALSETIRRSSWNAAVSAIQRSPPGRLAVEARDLVCISAEPGGEMVSRAEGGKTPETSRLHRGAPAPEETPPALALLCRCALQGQQILNRADSLAGIGQSWRRADQQRGGSAHAFGRLAPSDGQDGALLLHTAHAENLYARGQDGLQSRATPGMRALLKMLSTTGSPTATTDRHRRRRLAGTLAEIAVHRHTSFPTLIKKRALQIISVCSSMKR